MTYPNRKKLTEYPIVTPTLADSVVNIQGNTVKRSTLQSILDLFNVNVPNASTSVKGIAQLSTQAEAELAASGTIGSINDTKIITPTGWRYAWNKALTLAWTFTSKINFSNAVNLRTLSVPLILEQGDLYYITSGFLGTGVYLKTEDLDTAKLITTADSAFEGAPGIIQIATQVETETGVIDNKGITPLKLRQNQFNSASVTATVLNPYIVTLNSIAGNIIIPTGIGCNIVSGTGQVITLNNNKITTTSVIEYTIRGYGKILLQGGYNVTTNQAQINLYNADVSAVTQLNIYFKILNP
jgi:hypothetical protein